MCMLMRKELMNSYFHHTHAQPGTYGVRMRANTKNTDVCVYVCVCVCVYVHVYMCVYVNV